MTNIFTIHFTILNIFISNICHIGGTWKNNITAKMLLHSQVNQYSQTLAFISPYVLLEMM